MKNRISFFVVTCICIISIFTLASCGKEMADSNEIVDLELFAKIEKGMTYDKVTEILHNPGQKSQYNSDIYVYRLKDDLAAFINFTFDGADKVVEKFKIEPLVDPALYEYVVSEIERQGFYELNWLDIFGSTGIGFGSSGNSYEYYLSDGRVVIIVYEDFTFRATSAKVVSTWFEPHLEE